MVTLLIRKWRPWGRQCANPTSPISVNAPFRSFTVFLFLVIFSMSSILYSDKATNEILSDYWQREEDMERHSHRSSWLLSTKHEKDQCICYTWTWKPESLRGTLSSKESTSRLVSTKGAHILNFSLESATPFWKIWRVVGSAWLDPLLVGGGGRWK